MKKRATAAEAIEPYHFTLEGKLESGPNARGRSWHVGFTRDRKWRERVERNMGYAPTIFHALPLFFVFTRIAPKAIRDQDNLIASFKAIRDAATRALGIKDDAEQPGFLEYRYEQDRSKIGRFYGVRIEVYKTRPDEWEK